MNILRKLSALFRAMASPSTDDRVRDSGATEPNDAGKAPAVEGAQQPKGKRAEVQGRPLDRSRVADLLDQQASVEDAPAQRQKGDRS